MKILFVVYGSIAQISGGYLYDRKVLSALKDKNCFIEVLEIRKWPYIIAPLQSFFTPIRSLFKYTGGGLKDNYDLVIIDELTHPSLFLALVLRKHSRRKVAVLVHHLKSKEAIGFPWRAVSRLFEKTLLKNADLIIVNSTTTARTVTDLQKMPIPVHICRPGRDTLVSYPVEVKVRTRNPHKQPVGIITVGNVIRRKGHRILIQCLANLNNLPWKLAIVGNTRIDPSYTQKLLKLIRRHGLDDRIHFYGRVSDDDLVTLYDKADIFVFPSEYEGYGIALAEAVSFQLPYVALNSGAIHEITGNVSKNSQLASGKGDIQRRPGGFLVNPEHPSNLQFAISNLIKDAELRARLSGEASELAAALPTWKDTGECFFSAVQEALFQREISSSA